MSLKKYKKYKNIKLCSSCGKNSAEEEHTCPYQEDINDDHEYTCDCCYDCRLNCVESI